VNVAGRARLEVDPHPRGPWLVRAGRRVLAVPPALGRALLPLHGIVVERRRLAAGLQAGLSGDAAAQAPAAAMVADWLAGGAEKKRGRGRVLPARGLPIRVPLLPAVAVRAAAAVLAPLAAWPALAVMATAGLGAALVFRPWSALCPMSPPALFLFAAGAFWHELGHAAALRREGYRPGGIGAGLLVCVPVLYADVSAAGLLPRPGRLRVDLAGLAFQAGAAGVLAVVGAAPGPSPGPAAAARTAAFASLLAVAYGLLPLPRTDGSWALRDALDTPGPPGPTVARLHRALRLLQAGLLGLACVLLPARLLGLVAWACARAGLPPDRGVLAIAARLLSALALAWWLRHVLRRRSAGARPISGGPRVQPALSCVGEPSGGEDLPVLDDDDDIPAPGDEPATMALDGVLDLHLFAPAEARALVEDWLDASRDAGLRDLRIIHGKGIGALRTMVHAALAARHDVESYGLANDAGSWGATVIRMKP
jgi:hypothetical protein